MPALRRGPQQALSHTMAVHTRVHTCRHLSCEVVQGGGQAWLASEVNGDWNQTDFAHLCMAS